GLGGTGPLGADRADPDPDAGDRGRRGPRAAAGARLRGGTAHPQGGAGDDGRRRPFPQHRTARPVQLHRPAVPLDAGRQAVSAETVFVGPAPRLALSVAGEGELVLFLHGIGGNRGNWSRQVDFFARTHKSAAWDARGYGESDDYEGPLDFSIFS